MNNGDNSALPARQPDATFVARLEADESEIRALADFLAEMLDPDSVLSTYETAAGWMLEIHFDTRPDDDAFADLRGLIAAQAGTALADRLTLATIARADWVAESLKGLKPVSAGRFVIHGGHDRGRVPAHRIGIEIEAALAFGTGHHGTTRGCLLALDSLARRLKPRRILDIGTGTGVLAIAAARLLRSFVLASDIDLQAVAVAQENARLNHAPGIRFLHAPGVTAREFRRQAPFDLIFANILVGPLKRLAAPVAPLLAPGGRIILSGLLHEHANAAMVAYQAQGLTLERRIRLDEWTTLVMRRGNRP